MRAHRTGRGVAATLSVVVLAACQAPAASSPEPAPATSESSTTTASSTPAAVEEETITAGVDYEPFGHFLFKRPFNTGEDPRVDWPAELYVIGHGPVTLNAQNLFPGKEVTAESYTSIGTEAEPMIAAVVQTREEAQGLDPQQFVTVLAAIDPAGQTVVHTTEVLRGASATDSAPHRLTGSPNATAAAFSTDGTSATTFAYDAVTGKKLWEKPGWLEGPVLGAVTILSSPGPGTQDDHETPCQTATDVEVATGKVLHTLKAGTLGSPCPVIEVIAIDENAGTSQQAEQQKYVRITADTSDKEVTYEALTGAERTLPATLVAADPHSDLVFPLDRVSNRTMQRAEPFGVLDTTTGKAVWTLDTQKAYQLDATVRAIYKGKLYLKTTDQEPVVDLATGETIADNDPRYPIGAVDSWTYWSDGTLDKE